MKPTIEDHLLAAKIATEAGELLLDVRSQMTQMGAEAAEIMRVGDAQSHEYIVSALQADRPDDAILSEEGADDLNRLAAKRVWIVDPLDGTREFGEIPRSDWAVHVALVIDGVPAAGAVALPAANTTLSTAEPPTLPAQTTQLPKVIVSRTRRPPVAQMLADQLNGQYIEMGSAGAKSMAVVLADADIYPHSGGQYEWDSCAPVAVALAAGLHCSRLDGSPLIYNRENPYLPDILICRPEWAASCLELTANFDYS